MYDIDDRDRVRELGDVPQSSVGAPFPFICSDESCVVLAYYVQEDSPGWDGSRVRIVCPSEGDEPIAIVRFTGCRAHIFGPPSDEAFAGHPLAGRGLHPYGVFEVDDSSWIRRLERMNSVHRNHRPERFLNLRHLIFTFHDSTFECACDGFDVRLALGSIRSAVPEMIKLLD